MDCLAVSLCLPTVSDPPFVLFLLPVGCSAELAGFELHANTLPVGVWGPYFANSAAECAASCTLNSDRCVAALWEDATVLPLSDDAKCQLVSEISGYTPDVSEGVDLYVMC
jgi:hypothetical protein